MRRLEIIALNARDAKAAQKAGADRIELVSAMEVGGLSPAIDTVKEVLAAVTIPVNVMVRLTAESFTYSSEQFSDLLAYIEQVKDLGINGLVFGSLDANNNVDTQQLAQIKAACGSLDFTFHRAIDEDYDKYKENFEVVNGVSTTVLTSGGTKYPIVENIELLKSISHGQTRVLVGGGINASNYQLLFNSLPNCDFHIGSLAYKDGDFTRGIDELQISNIIKKLHCEN